MKAGIIFTGTGPILILTTHESFSDDRFVEKLAAKGLKKFIAYEVDDELVKERYGKHFNVVMGDLKQSDDLRVLDYDGHHIFSSFKFSEIKESVLHEA
jgi:hypothetical protein